MPADGQFNLGFNVSNHGALVATVKNIDFNNPINWDMEFTNNNDNSSVQNHLLLHCTVNDVKPKGLVTCI